MTVNLLVLIVDWTVTSVNYNLILFFMVYIPGNVFINTSVATISEIIGYTCSAFVFRKFGGRLSFIVSFVLSAVGGFFIMYF